MQVLASIFKYMQVYSNACKYIQALTGVRLYDLSKYPSFYLPAEAFKLCCEI